MYKRLLRTDATDGLIQREVSSDDISFADTIAAALRSLLGHRPQPVSEIPPPLQGNLCEFCVWELGEKHWELYAKRFTTPANAGNPWKGDSSSGIDILAIDDSANTVFLIEVKSSKGEGSRAISSKEGSLKADFRHLFEGSLDKRVLLSVNELVAYLKRVLERDDLAEKVVEATGDRPEKCAGAHLIGVLVCRAGEQRESNARKRAFQRLHQWLLHQGWQANQCEYRCVELVDFDRWLSRVVEEVTR